VVLERWSGKQHNAAAGWCLTVWLTRDFSLMRPQKNEDPETYSGLYWAENANTGYIYPILVRSRCFLCPLHLNWHCLVQ